MARHEVWRRNYRQRPYLQDATDEELTQRLRDVIENLTALTLDGRLSPLPPGAEGEKWMELFTHILEAYGARRSQPPDNFLRGAKVPRPDDPITARALSRVRNLNLPTPGTYLVKLGKREHMIDLFERGRLRVSPASSYSDPSLNAAIKDDELSISAIAMKGEVQITIPDDRMGPLKGPVDPIGNVTFTSRSTTNYFVCCLTHTLDPRLFADFGYDACVIVKDVNEFRRRLNIAMRLNLGPWLAFDSAIAYVDPYNTDRRNMNVFFGKHLRYSYQREYRFIWVPPQGYAGAFAPQDVNFGSVRPFAELVTL